MFGYGWSSSYTWSIATTSAQVAAIVTEPDGSEVTAMYTPTSHKYVVPSWADSTLTRRLGVHGLSYGDRRRPTNLIHWVRSLL